jgi:hypothetical protein
MKQALEYLIAYLKAKEAIQNFYKHRNPRGPFSIQQQVDEAKEITGNNRRLDKAWEDLDTHGYNSAYFEGVFEQLKGE